MVTTELPEPNVHSFIIKVWVDASEAGSQARWHGHITHVPGGERKYVRSLEEIFMFIAPYLRPGSSGMPQEGGRW